MLWHDAGMSLARDPADWLEETPSRANRLFLRTPQGRSLSYAMLREQSGRIAAALIQRVVLPGDRIAVQVDKSPEAVLLYVACLRSGAVFVPINVANTPNEVDYFLRDSQPRIAVIRPADRALLESVAIQAGVRHVETLGADGEGSLPALAGQSAAGCPPPRNFDANSPAAIAYT